MIPCAPPSSFPHPTPPHCPRHSPFSPAVLYSLLGTRQEDTEMSDCVAALAHSRHAHSTTLSKNTLSSGRWWQWRRLSSEQTPISLSFFSLFSALKDRRFDPISLSEFPRLRCTVSLLHSFELGASWDDWVVGVHGITIEFSDPHTSTRRSATFLPEVAAHERWDKRQTLEHLVKKSGCGAGAGAVLAVLKLTRYQSATCTLTYDEYLKIKEPKRFARDQEDAGRAEEAAITVPA